jgi:hypothetical protein
MSSIVLSDLNIPVFLTRVSPETLEDLSSEEGPGSNDFFSSKSFSFSKGLKIPVVSEVFIVFLLKALQKTTIHSTRAKIIPACRKGALLTGMLFAKPSFWAGSSGKHRPLKQKNFTFHETIKFKISAKK